MNAKQVLNKIMTLLAKDDMELTYAKLKDGTIVESKTFDVGQELFVISEDGARTPAPNGTHELMLKDTEGNETLLKVITEGGEIKERENVELADEDADMVKVEPIPQADGAKAVEDVQMSEETKEVGKLPSTGDGVPADTEDMKDEEKEIELKDVVEKLQYRIEEMEKKMEEMGKMKEEEMKEEEKMKEDEKEKMKEEEDMELPKLDGAPVETKMSLVESNKKNYGKKSMNSQDSFLSKLYK